MSMVFCRGCGKEIHESAETCPHCGAPQKSKQGKTSAIKSQTVAAVLAAFLGSLGIHRFYIGKTLSGILYLVFCWTGIPFFLASIETYLIAFMSPDNWAKKYNNGEPSAPVPGILKFLLMLPAIILLGAFVFGLGFAIILPAYQDYQARASVSEALLSMSGCKIQLAEDFATAHVFPKGSPYAICGNPLPKGVKGLGMATGKSAVEITAFLTGGSLEGKEVSLFGTVSPTGDISWRCVSASIPRSVLPRSCDADAQWTVNTRPFETFEEYKSHPAPTAPAPVQESAPTPAPAQEAASTPAAQASDAAKPAVGSTVVMPAQFVGQWATNAKGCQDIASNTPTDSTMEINEKAMSVGTVYGCDLSTILVSEDKAFKGNFTCHSEGEESKVALSFTMMSNLLQFRDANGVKTYMRCKK